MRVIVHKIIDQSIDDRVVRQWCGVEGVGGDGWMRLLLKVNELANANVGDEFGLKESDWL